jgi:hypothetical protein
MMSGNHSWQVPGGAAVTVRFSVTVRQVREDGSKAPLDGELAAALAGPAEQFAGLAAWAADEAGYLDHGEREKVISQEGREPLRAQVVTRREMRLPAGPEHTKQRGRRAVGRLKDLARVFAQEEAVVVEVRGPQPAQLARLFVENDLVAGPREQQRDGHSARSAADDGDLAHRAPIATGTIAVDTLRL